MNKFILLFCIVNITGSVALGADSEKQSSNKKVPPLTAKQRQKMADAHEKMADCLRSNKPESECHKEMMIACQEAMGKESCPMMSGKGKGMHEHMME